MAYTVMVVLFMSGIVFPTTLAQCGGSCTNCCINVNTDCVSGDMKVKELERGTVAISQLSADSIVQGLRGSKKTPDWCKVEAVYPRAVNKTFTTYDGFTKDHMVVVGDKVRPYGQKGNPSKTQLYVLATECDAVVNVDNQAFTPLSTTFCARQLDWSDYVVLMAAIRRVTSRTGYFWYLSDAFYDNKGAKITSWADMLPDMCAEMVRCASDGKCQKFEKIVEEFVREHLNKKYVVLVQRAFPNIGGDVEKNQAGTVSEVVYESGKINIILISTMSVIACLLIVIGLLTYGLVRAIKKRSPKEEQFQEKPNMDHVSPKNFNYEKA